MHFGLSEEQTLLQDMLRRCLDEHLDIETLKRKAGQPCDPDLWGALVELGVPGVLIPEDHGGSGLGMMEAEVIAESMGRSVAPVPFLGTTVLAPLAWQLARVPLLNKTMEWFLPRAMVVQGLVQVYADPTRITEQLVDRYFDRHLRTSMVAEFARLLRPGGYLMIGHSETLIGIEGSFRSLKSSVYQRLNPGVAS